LILARIRYDWTTLAGDLSGGAVAALIALPSGLAMASLMGLPPVLGLVTSVTTAPITALLGRNPLLIGGTASATVPFIAQPVRSQGIAGAAKVCMAASVFMQPSAFIISFSVIVAALLCTRYLPRAPAPLIGVLTAIGVAATFGLHQKEVGRLPLEIPKLAGFSWARADVLNVTPAAFGLAFVASVNILITSRVVEHFRGRHKHLKRGDADAELGAYGVANMVAGVFAAPMSVGIPARSLASVRCGGSTRMSKSFMQGSFLLFSEWAAITSRTFPYPRLPA